jgi:hypothetical protein
MSTIQGTITAVHHIGRSYTGIAHDGWNVALIHVSFPAYIATTDTINIAAVGAGIASATRSGKTNTLQRAMCAGPGKNSVNTACYAGALTVSSDALTGGLKDVSGSEVSVPLGTTVPVQILVAYTEA